MNLRNIGSNQTTIETRDGIIVLFSYSTPVAAFVPGRGYVKTSRHYSSTTSRHINVWATHYKETVSQDYLDNLVD